MKTRIMTVDRSSLPAPLRPRKKPAQARAVYTVGVILEAATRILEDSESSAYTTNAIAERAGVSIGSLYQYFPNKNAITAALIEHETDGLLAAMRRVSTECDGHDALSAMIAVAVSYQFRRPRLARFLDEHEEQFSLQAREASIDETMTPLVVSVLQRLQGPRPEAPRAAAGDVMAITRALTDAAGRRCGTSDADDLAQKIARAVYGYLGIALPDSRSVPVSGTFMKQGSF